MHTNNAAIINIPVITPIELITNPKRELSILEFFFSSKTSFFCFSLQKYYIKLPKRGSEKEKMHFVGGKNRIFPFSYTIYTMFPAQIP